MPRRLPQPSSASNEEIDAHEDSDGSNSDNDQSATADDSSSESEPSPSLDDEPEPEFTLPTPSDFASREEYREAIKKAQLHLADSNTKIRDLKLQLQTLNNQVRQLKSRGAKGKSKASKSKKAKENDAAELGRRFMLLYELFLSKQAFLKERPANDSLFPDRYKTAASRLRGQTAELYEALDATLHSSIASSPAFRDEFYNALILRRRYSWNQLRSKTAAQIFGFLNPPPGIYVAKNGKDRAQNQVFRDFLAFPGDKSNYRPLLFRNRVKDFTGFLRAPWLPQVLRASLLGANSIAAVGSTESNTPAPNSSGKIWSVNCTTPGGMAYAVISTMFIHSPDESFGSAGAESGILYERTFDFIKRLIVDALRENPANDTARLRMLDTIEYWNSIVFASIDDNSPDAVLFDDDVADGVEALNSLSLHDRNDDYADADDIYLSPSTSPRASPTRAAATAPQAPQTVAAVGAGNPITENSEESVVPGPNVGTDEWEVVDVHSGGAGEPPAGRSTHPEPSRTRGQRKAAAAGPSVAPRRSRRTRD